MGSFSRTQSPVLTMPPSAAHQSHFGMPMFPHQPSPLAQAVPFKAASSWAQPPARPSLAQTAGRKRSREEASINLDVEEAKLETIEPVKEPEDEWVYGEGMVLIKSPSTYVANAGSQSGTWLEEKAAKETARRNEEARSINQQDRPSLRSNKSQRLDMNNISIPSTNAPSNRTNPARDTVVDSYTLHLGIGWSRISDNEHIQAASRGWARYIENHFPVTNVNIQLESKGLQSYLVEASEGYFLFGEDLRQGQLVSKDLNQAFLNLKASPPIFEGTAPMAAAGTPQPTAAVDVDMDMS
ncbi:SGNH hydrolase-type esterase domain-containing protein [Apiospora arundinis]